MDADSRAAVWIAVPVAVLVAAALAVASRRRLCVVFGAGDAAGEALERCLAMLRAPYERRGGRYDVSLAGGSLEVSVRRGLGSTAFVTFRGETRHRKARLIRSLFLKQFNPLVPRIRVRIR